MRFHVAVGNLMGRGRKQFCYTLLPSRLIKLHEGAEKCGVQGSHTLGSSKTLRRATVASGIFLDVTPSNDLRIFANVGNQACIQAERIRKNWHAETHSLNVFIKNERKAHHTEP